MTSFKALLVEKQEDKSFTRNVTQRSIDDLPEGTLLIKVHYSSLNYKDALSATGNPGVSRNFPHTPGIDAAGTVVSCDDNRFKEGDEVTFGSWGNGAFSDYVLVPEDGPQLKSKSLNFEEAASFQTAYLTAYVSLVRRGDLVKGENLLVHGATGGVGMAAVQLAKHLDAKVIATGTSLEKLEKTKDWGADHIVLTHKDENVSFREEVKDLTDGKGADVIYDPVGGDVFDESIRCINWGGRLLIVGFASGRIPSAPVNMPLIKGFSIIGVRAGEYGRRDPIKGEENNQAIREIAETGAFQPYVCREFPLLESKEAIRFLEQRKLLGKVAIVMD